MKYEYDPDNPHQWQPFEPPPKDTAFERELELIAGQTNGRQNLRLVWAGDLKDDRTEHTNQLKYHIGWTVPKTIGWKYVENGEEFFTKDIETIPPHILGVVPVQPTQALGMPRWVIERYTTPETLRAMNRFTNRTNHEFFKVLRDFPREGIYETWIILETKEGLYREPGADIVPFIRHKWKLEQLSAEEQERKFREWQAQQQEQKERHRREQFVAALQGDIVLPYEEKLLREWQNNKIKEDLERERHASAAVSVYQN